MSDSITDGPSSNRSITPADIAAAIRGEATPEQERRIAEAAQDPASSVGRWLESVASLSKHLTRKPSAEDDAIRKLDSVLALLVKKRWANTLSDADLMDIGASSGAQPGSLSSLTPIAANMAVQLISAALVKLHPESIGELANIETRRQR
jgi:hypothetical protein